MTTSATFHEQLERKLRQQLAGQRVGFLLGAGSSSLKGNGYPLATELWDKIKNKLSSTHRTAIQQKLDQGANGLEHALDLLDDGSPNDTPYRHAVTTAIADLFLNITPPLDQHAHLLRALSRRPEHSVPIFNLNYDPIIERAAEQARIRVTDGFIGIEQAYFDVNAFQQTLGLIQRGTRSPLFQPTTGTIHLFKLHGSLGWYEHPSDGIRRCHFHDNIPADARRLMIPPQHRKATEAMTPPYATLWSEFRRLLRHGPQPLHRLVTVGYGCRDEHVNSILENGIARQDFTLIILAQHLPPDARNRWAPKPNVILISEDECSLNGTRGPGHPALWSFERLSEEA
jgi:hypothetical protein